MPRRRTAAVELVRAPMERTQSRIDLEDALSWCMRFKAVLFFGGEVGTLADLVEIWVPYPGKGLPKDRIVGVGVGEHGLLQAVEDALEQIESLR